MLVGARRGLWVFDARGVEVLLLANVDPNSVLHTDTKQLCEHQAGSGEADAEDKVCRSGL